MGRSEKTRRVKAKNGLGRVRETAFAMKARESRK